MLYFDHIYLNLGKYHKEKCILALKLKSCNKYVIKTVKTQINISVYFQIIESFCHNNPKYFRSCIN